MKRRRLKQFTQFSFPTLHEAIFGESHNSLQHILENLKAESFHKLIKGLFDPKRLNTAAENIHL